MQNIREQCLLESFETRADTAVSAIDNAIRVIQKRNPLGQKTHTSARIVCFSSSVSFIEELTPLLKNDPFKEVFTITQNTPADTAALSIIEFYASSQPGAILLCDPRGEEGLNLQFAHGIVHLDLPLNPERIEQRIGRLDRYGRQYNPIPTIFQWIVTPYDETNEHPWQAWFTMLI